MLHVANGDEALSALRGAGLPGEVVAWSDVLDQGPVRGDPGTAQFREVRARWLAENGAGSFDEVRAQLERWDVALCSRSDETVLWFEADLCCQLALLHHLVLVDAAAVVTQDPVPTRGGYVRRAARAVIQAHQRVPRPGEVLSMDGQLATIHADGKIVLHGIISLGVTEWSGMRKPSAASRRSCCSPTSAPTTSRPCPSRPARECSSRTWRGASTWTSSAASSPSASATAIRR